MVLILMLTTVCAGLLAGYAVGGRLGRLGLARIRAVWLLWIAAVLQFVQFRFTAVRVRIEAGTGLSLLVSIFGLVGAWVIVNLRGRSGLVRAAAVVILVGGAMNAVVIAANGRMPTSAAAAAAIHPSAAQTAAATRSPKHEVATPATKMGWLGDVIPVTPIRAVISAGDIVLLVGAVCLIAGAMRDPAAMQAPVHSTVRRPPTGSE
jgi:hypothetical protein